MQNQGKEQCGLFLPDIIQAYKALAQTNLTPEAQWAQLEQIKTDHEQMGEPGVAVVWNFLQKFVLQV